MKAFKAFLSGIGPLRGNKDAIEYQLGTFLFSTHLELLAKN